MTCIEILLYAGLSCDNPACTAEARIDDPVLMFTAAARTHRDLLRADGWTTWVGRSQRSYCPSHGPAVPMRAVPW